MIPGTSGQVVVEIVKAGLAALLGHFIAQTVPFFPWSHAPTASLSVFYYLVGFHDVMHYVSVELGKVQELHMINVLD